MSLQLISMLGVVQNKSCNQYSWWTYYFIRKVEGEQGTENSSLAGDIDCLDES